MKKFIVPEENIRRNEDGTYTLIPGNFDRYFPPEYMAIGPLDGRYKKETADVLSEYFSEFALVKNRVKVEVLWLQYQYDNLAGENYIISKVKEKHPKIDFSVIFRTFSYDEFYEVKEIEAKINHDVKAVELWVANQLDNMGLPELRSFVHFGCTSEDITNPAYAWMIKDSLMYKWFPNARALIGRLEAMSLMYQDIPMIAHTHGQPATPTTVGKELHVYVFRLKKLIKKIEDIEVLAKFNGATGNYAAIQFVYPWMNWQETAKDFVERYLHLSFNPVTTQIESHDYIVEIAAEMAHFNRVLSNFCSDMWTYISMEYFKQIPIDEEVGSSTMPNKVNPIDFENGEMNFRKSTSDLEFLCEWLMSSRMQRDLRDSTALRNIGVAFGHSLLGIKRTMKGLKKVTVNETKIMEELNEKWEVLAEAIQTTLRKYGVPDAYNQLKKLTRGRNITEKALKEFLESEEIKKAISNTDRKALLEMRPEDYIGIASEIVYNSHLYDK